MKIRFYQPVYRIGDGYQDYYAPNIYKTKEEAMLFLSELEKNLGGLADKYVLDLYLDCYEEGE